MSRIPVNATVEIQEAFRELFEELDRLRGVGTGNVSLQGQRVTGSGKPIQPGDLVNKQHLDAQIEDVLKRIETLSHRQTRLARATGTGGTVTPTGTFPSPNHALDFGYYLEDGNRAPDILDFYSEVKGYTNLYHTWTQKGRQYGFSETPAADQFANMRVFVKRAFDDGKVIYADFGFKDITMPTNEGQLNAVLDVLQPYWSRVKYVDLADEPGWTQAQVNQYAAFVRAGIQSRGLAVPLIGYSPLRPDIFTDRVNVDVDFIGIECYVDPPGNDSSQANVDFLKDFIARAKDAIPPSKKLVLIMMGYARNGAWTNYATLKDLQAPAYLAAYNDPRVLSINIFSYGRISGTRELANNGNADAAQVQVLHKQMGAAIFAQGTGGATCGGIGNPANCPRYCRGGDYEGQVRAAEDNVIAANPAFFASGPPWVLANGQQAAFIAAVVGYMNLTYPTLESIADAADGKQMLVRLRAGFTFREDYALWATDNTVRYPPGAYRATCTPGDFN